MPSSPAGSRPGSGAPGGEIRPWEGQTITKDEARRLVYRRLREARAARFPFPVEGRIPNFKGAEAAAERLRSLAVYRAARGVKVNPDAPQLPVRAAALADGKTLYLPTPRLRGSFLVIRPERVPAGEIRRAASLSTCHEYGEPVTLADLAAGRPPIDLVVTGAVAVTRDGARAGKGEGYGDLEYAILQELGYPQIPVATTVHPLQIVDALPHEPHDLSVDYVVTPDEVITTRTPHPKPTRIDWGLLDPEALDGMPVLAELRRLTWERRTVPDVLAPGLDVIFVGINPGRMSAALGHHFGGPGNLFWRLLHEAGFTPRRLAPHEDRLLLTYGLGVTNLVGRATRGEAELSWGELVAHAPSLRAKIERFRPRAVAVLGKQIYRAFAGLPRSAPLSWGTQPRETVAGVVDFLAPNPSPRSTVPYAARLALFRELHRLVRGSRS